MSDPNVPDPRLALWDEVARFVAAVARANPYANEEGLRKIVKYSTQEAQALNEKIKAVEAELAREK